MKRTFSLIIVVFLLQCSPHPALFNATWQLLDTSVNRASNIDWGVYQISFTSDEELLASNMLDCFKFGYSANANGKIRIDEYESHGYSPFTTADERHTHGLFLVAMLNVSRYVVEEDILRLYGNGYALTFQRTNDTLRCNTDQ